jgi:hypothetical protein
MKRNQNARLLSGLTLFVSVSFAGAEKAIEQEPTPLASWTFDREEVGKAPPGWSFRETRPGSKHGTWKVAPDPTAPSTANVLTLTTEADDQTFNLAVVEKTSFKDVDLRVRLKAHSGKEDQGGGLLWRCKDENNYYICRINPLESNFRVYKVVEGKRSQLQSAEFKAETGKWYEVRAVMIGDRITCYLDGKEYLDVKDDTFHDAGLIGLWTKADASSSFDNLVVYPPSPEKDEAKTRTGEAGKDKKEGESNEKDDDDDA